MKRLKKILFMLFFISVAIAQLGGLIKRGDFIPEAASSASPQNILLILFDKCRTDAIGAYGAKDVSTPNIDWLASTGVRFVNCYAPQAVCCPSRASIITGLFPHAHGMQKNVYPIVPAKNNYTYQEPFSNPFHNPRFNLWLNFPLLLHNAGYETAHIGKWHLGPGNPGFFDTWKSFNSLLPHWIGKPQESEYRHDVQTGQGVEFIERNAHHRFFLYQSYYSPHEPLDPPEKFLEFYRGKSIEHASYYASVSNLDWNVGRLLDALRKLDLIDKTFIILTSDHGRTWLDRPGALPKLGMSIAYDEAARVPLIMRYPPLLPQGQAWNSGVSLVDLMPTILDAAKINIRSPVVKEILGGLDPSLHGRSLLGELRSRQDRWQYPVIMENISQAAIQGSHFEERAIRTERWKLILRQFDASPRLRVDELYDMANDPGETRNLIASASHKDVVKELAGMLKKWGEEKADPLSVHLGNRSLND